MSWDCIFGVQNQVNGTKSDHIRYTSDGVGYDIDLSYGRRINDILVEILCLIVVYYRVRDIVIDSTLLSPINSKLYLCECNICL